MSLSKLFKKKHDHRPGGPCFSRRSSKGHGKGKPYQSYRKEVDKDEKPLIINSQKVYLDPPT
jgi:hypothetical protein